MGMRTRLFVIMVFCCNVLLAQKGMQEINMEYENMMESFARKMNQKYEKFLSQNIYTLELRSVRAGDWKILKICTIYLPENQCDNCKDEFVREYRKLRIKQGFNMEEAHYTELRKSLNCVPQKNTNIRSSGSEGGYVERQAQSGTNAPKSQIEQWGEYNRRKLEASALTQKDNERLKKKTTRIPSSEASQGNTGNEQSNRETKDYSKKIAELFASNNNVSEENQSTKSNPLAGSNADRKYENTSNSRNKAPNSTSQESNNGISNNQKQADILNTMSKGGAEVSMDMFNGERNVPIKKAPTVDLEGFNLRNKQKKIEDDIKNNNIAVKKARETLYKALERSKNNNDASQETIINAEIQSAQKQLNDLENNGKKLTEILKNVETEIKKLEDDNSEL